jgi:hypothetical protein
MAYRQVTGIHPNLPTVQVKRCSGATEYWVAETQADLENAKRQFNIQPSQIHNSHSGYSSYQPAQAARSYTPSVPSSPSGWWLVDVGGGRSWTYSDPNLAARCVAAHPGSTISARSAPSGQNRSMYNRAF